MIPDLPPKVWVPEKPAIVRASSLKELDLRKFAPALFGGALLLGASKADPIVTYLGGAAFPYNAAAYSTSFTLDAATPDRMIVAIFQCTQLGTDYTNAYCYNIFGVSPIGVASCMSSGSGIVMYRASVPTNTAGINVGFARGGNMAYGIMQVYSIKNLESQSPVGTTGLSSVASLPARAGGVGLAALFCATADPTASGINVNKQRVVCGGTGSNYGQNAFHIAPTANTTYSVGGGYSCVSASWS